MRLSNEDLKNARKRLLQMRFENGVGHLVGTYPRSMR
jgi:ribosomal protein L29